MRTIVKNRKFRKIGNLLFVGVAAVILGCAGSTYSQQLFDNPDEAVKALKKAAAAKDSPALSTLFGPRVRDLLSGDPVADRNAFNEFAENMSKSTKLRQLDAGTYILEIGDYNWPFAAPIVKSGNQWKFDADAGADELLNRRIGSNEIDAIYACQAYALAQYDYFNNGDWDGDQVSEYAQKIASSKGTKDGLFWEKTDETDPDSPLGQLFAYAASEGYTGKTGTTRTAAPFHGYYYKVLYRQGPSAPGGRFGYIINGNMIAGFALVAYPATYGNSGVMTFVVNQEGRVYEKDLGPNTKALAEAMVEYNPDVTWALVDLDFDDE
jgi:hypothetical protein